MSSLASSSSSQPQAHWITPAEQLRRLHNPMVEELSRVTPLISDLANMVAEYVGGGKSLTNWHTSLVCLNALPSKIPPLPTDIGEILESKCPIYSNDEEEKSDDAPLKVKDTHFLALIPEEFVSLNHLGGKILEPYGKKKYVAGYNPLKFSYFDAKGQQTYGDVKFSPTHWVLMTRNLLPRSQSKSGVPLVQLVSDLSKKAFVNYEVPTLQETFAAITTHMVASGERLYGTKPNNFTYVQEKTDGFPLAIGGFCSVGVMIDSNYKSGNVGLAALRKF